MSKLNTQRQLPQLTGNVAEDFRRLYIALQEKFRDIDDQVNAISEGRITGHYNAQSATPTGVLLSKGDFIAHLDPVEAGSAGSKYVLTGWMAVEDGTASGSTIVEVRGLTGN